MLVQFGLCWVVLSFIYLFYAHIVRPVFLSPLRKVPSAHWTCSFSSFWINSYRRIGSQAWPEISAAHSQKGSIVRLSPHEISVSSLEDAKKVYVEKGGFPKPVWWATAFASYGVINMTSMVGGHGNKEHAARKRHLGNVYAKSFVLGNGELKSAAETVLGTLREVLDGAVTDKGGVLDVFKFLNGAAHADLTSAYLFGLTRGTRFLQTPGSQDTYYNDQNAWLQSKPGWIQARTRLEEFGLQRCGLADAASEDEEKGNGGDAVVYNQLYSRGLRGNDLASEMLDHFMAGSEGPRITLTYMEWELSRSPTTQAKLREELLLLDQDPASDLMALDSLPILDAILTETIRLYPPTPGNQPRITPPAGTTFQGFYIPGGTEVSAPFGIFHFDPSIFPAPDHWEPDRWLMEDQTKLEEMRRRIWAFGKGSRACTGKDFTLIGKSSSAPNITSHSQMVRFWR